MTGTELFITSAAVLLSPLIAVDVQKRIEKIREKANRRASIFHTLMATRGNRVCPEHVGALNRIDLEFYEHPTATLGRRRTLDKAVVSAWRLYLDHLNTPFAEGNENTWTMKGDELFVNLLIALARSLGFELDSVHMKRSLYVPVAHSNQQLQDQTMRDNFSKLLSGEKPLSISITMPGQEVVTLTRHELPDDLTVRALNEKKIA